jgi:hypothetical protein
LRVSRLLRFAYFEELVGADIVQRLADARRPRYLDRCRIRISQAKAQPLVIRREIAPRSGSKPYLPIHANPRAKPVAVSACAVKGNRQPMLVATTVNEDLRRRPERGYDGVYPSVIVQISESSAAPRQRDSDPRISEFESTLELIAKRGFSR